MPTRLIFLSRAARRNYHMARIASVLVFVAGIAALVAFVVLGIRHALSL